MTVTQDVTESSDELSKGELMLLREIGGGRMFSRSRQSHYSTYPNGMMDPFSNEQTTQLRRLIESGLVGVTSSRQLDRTVWSLRLAPAGQRAVSVAYPGAPLDRLHPVAELRAAVASATTAVESALTALGDHEDGLGGEDEIILADFRDTLNVAARSLRHGYRTVESLWREENS